MVYFICDVDGNVLCETGWIFSDNCAIPLANQGSAITATTSTLIDNLKCGHGGGLGYHIDANTECDLVEFSGPYHQYHSRIYRPTSGLCGPVVDNTILTNANSQLAGLMQFLSTICRTIYPKSKLDESGTEVGNLATYGHDIRNGMLLACTEVEAQLKGVLRANNISAYRHNYSTVDYVKRFDLKIMRSTSTNILA